MKFKHLLAAALLFCTAGAWAQTDVTSTYIQNAGFDDCTAETSDVAAKTIKDYSSNGWTNAATGSFTTIAVTAYDGGKKVGSSITPSTKKDGSTVSGNTLGIIAGWGDDVKIQSSDITLPAGFYTLTIDHYLTSSTNNYSTSRFGFVTASNSYIVASTTFTASTWTTETVTFTLSESTTGKIQIGLLGNNKTGSGAPAVFYDDVKLTWTDPNLVASQYSLGGYIKKATALNGVLNDGALTSAIATAQGVLDEATTSAACNTASNNLNSAITTAISGATTVSLTNANFDTDVNIAADGTNSGTRNSMATDAKPYIWDITGWTANFTFSNTAAQGNTAVYGAACSGTNGTNGTNSPATDMFGATDGGTLHVSSGWSDQARYKQEVASLPSGRYIFYYEANNQNASATTINSNYFGVSGSAGDFYGTTNAFVYSDTKTFAYNTWTANAFEFDVAKVTDITFHVGLVGTTGGSGNGAKLWIDNVLVYRIGDVIVTDADAEAIIAQVDALDESVYNASDKTALANAKTTFVNSKTLDNYNALNSALVTAQNSINTYKTINSALTLVEGWTSDATTVTAPMRAKYTNGTYSDETNAANIYAEYQAAEIAALAAADATDYTTAILNPSFETGDMTGWTATSRSDTGVKGNDNATYTINNDVDGQYIFNSWGGSAENDVYQTIKNLPAGTYQLSALLAGFNGESLVLAANETTNSVTVTGDKTVGYTVNVVFTLDNAADVVIKASNTKATSADASFIKADNFTLKAYSDPLAALKEQLGALQTQAVTLLANGDYSNVTGAEKTTLTTLSTLVPEETEEAYNTAISNITAAISDFMGAKSNYDALATVNAEVAALATLTYADAAKKPAAVSATTAEEAATKADAQTAAIRAYYESNALAEGVAGAVNQTSKLTNPTNPTSTSGWTVNNTTGNSNMRTMSSEPYTNADGTTATGYFDSNSWGTAFASTFTQDVELEAGKYILTAKARGNGTTTYQVVANGETTDIAAINNSGGVFGRGWNDYTVEFTINAKTTVTLGINMETGSSANWLSFGDFRLVRLELYTTVADANDYSDLAAAIATAEAKTLGFEAGEYAPYNNVAALTALAAAKAIDPTVENMQEDVQAATAALTSATWTANAAEVDAIYDGQFANTEANATSGDINLPGWTKVNGIRMLVKDEATDPGLAYTDGKAALFSWGGTTLTYGEQTGYTLPLNKHSIYKLTFKASAWRDGTWPSWVSVDLDGVAQSGSTSVPGKINDAEGNPFRTYTYYLEPTADNSVLKIYMNQHFTVADLSLKLAVAEDVTIDEDADYTPAETYANVTLTRTIKADTWNTFVVPFDIDNVELKAVFGNDVAVAEFSENSTDANAVTVNFDMMDTPAITANTPVLLKGNAGTSFTFNGKLIKVGDAKVTGTNVDFIGTYNASTTVKAGDYFISANKLYKSEGGTTLKGTRAYIDARNATGNVKMFVDGIETGIDEINGTAVENGAIYNLAGQRVSNAQKGVFIVNGKKVIVK